MKPLTNCPDCSLPLGGDGKKCRCGWVAAKSDFRNRKTVPCEAVGCRQASLVKMPDDSNLCEWHYGEWWRNNYAKVKPRITTNGLCEEMRAAYLKSPMHAKKHGIVEREPGMDEEELAA